MSRMVAPIAKPGAKSKSRRAKTTLLVFELGAVGEVVPLSIALATMEKARR